MFSEVAIANQNQISPDALSRPEEQSRRFEQSNINTKAAAKYTSLALRQLVDDPNCRIIRAITCIDFFMTVRAGKKWRAIHTWLSLQLYRIAPALSLKGYGWKIHFPVFFR